MTNKTSIYLDTSVINFLFATDTPDHQAETVDFFDNYIRRGIYETFISNFVLEEINNTKDEQKRIALLQAIADYPLQSLPIGEGEEVENLGNLYVLQGIIPMKKKADAMHIAISVINRIDYLVSWNFQHLANADRERRVVAVNYANNYLHPIKIITPLHLMSLEI